MRTYGKGTSAISILVPSFSSKTIGTSALHPCPFTIAATIGMVFVSHEYIQRLVDSQRDTITQLENIKSHMVLLYWHIWAFV